MFASRQLAVDQYIEGKAVAAVRAAAAVAIVQPAARFVAVHSTVHLCGQRSARQVRKPQCQAAQRLIAPPQSLGRAPARGAP
jgi:hypothetical protein